MGSDRPSASCSFLLRFSAAAFTTSRVERGWPGCESFPEPLDDGLRHCNAAEPFVVGRHDISWRGGFDTVDLFESEHRDLQLPKLLKIARLVGEPLVKIEFGEPEP